MLDLEECWTAVENRDASANGSFFYGVRTTGVYCRPGCASRRPLRANTAFFETTAAAESAGFRACKRCRPNDASLAERRAAIIASACRVIEQADAAPSLAVLALPAWDGAQHHHHHVERELADGTRLSAITRHVLGLFRGVPGARRFRQHLATEAVKPGAGIAAFRAALALVAQQSPRPVRIAAA